MKSLNFKDQIEQNLSASLTSEDVLKEIIKSKDSPIRVKVEEIRNSNRSDLKLELPVYYFNCNFRHTSADYLNISDLTGFLFLDIDKLSNQEILFKTKENISKLKFVKACWISSSGTGLHMIVSVNGLTRDNFASTFDYLNNTYFNMMLDIKCKNINRAAFLSWDMECYINSNVQPLDTRGMVSTDICNSINKDIILINNKNNTLYSANHTCVDSSSFKREKCELEFIPKKAMRECFGKEQVMFENPIQFFTYYRKSVKVGNRNKTLRAIAAQLMTQNKHFTLGNLLFWLDNFNESHNLEQTQKEINSIAIQIFKQIERGTFKEIKGIMKSGMIHPNAKKHYTQKEKRVFAAQCGAVTKRKKTENAISNALEDMFNERVIITIGEIAERIGKSRVQVQTYYKQYKEQITIMNNLTKESYEKENTKS